MRRRCRSGFSSSLGRSSQRYRVIPGSLTSLTPPPLVARPGTDRLTDPRAGRSVRALDPEPRRLRPRAVAVVEEEAHLVQARPQRPAAVPDRRGRGERRRALDRRLRVLVEEVPVVAAVTGVAARRRVGRLLAGLD